MRVANLDMTDPNQNCPEGLRFIRRTEPPLRTCVQQDICLLPFQAMVFKSVWWNCCISGCFQSILLYLYNRALSIDDIHITELYPLMIFTLMVLA